MSARQAAERFGSHCLGETLPAERRGRGSVRQGKPRGSRLDAHAGFILGLVEAGTKDISLAEIVEHLANERGLTIGITSIWKFLDRHGLTFKKQDRPRGGAAAARMSSTLGRPGSTASSTSTLRS